MSSQFGLLDMRDDVSPGLDGALCRCGTPRERDDDLYSRSAAFNDRFPSTEPIPTGIANDRYGAIRAAWTAALARKAQARGRPEIRRDGERNERLTAALRLQRRSSPVGAETLRGAGERRG